MKTNNLFAYFSLLLLVFGWTGCASGPRVELDPDSKDFYETARLIMTSNEKDIFNHLPDKASREEFIQDFWDKRDPDPETEENEFQEEFYSRIDFANRRFKEGGRGYNTARGRIYLYFGYPDKIDTYPFTNVQDARGVLTWTFYRYGFAVQFIDRHGNGTYELDPYYGVYGDIFWAMERAMLGLPLEGIGDPNFKKKYMKFEFEHDKKSGEYILSVPLNTLSFAALDDKLYLEFDFTFYVYTKGQADKQVFQESRTFETTEDRLVEEEDAVFTFDFPGLAPGNYYFDVVVVAKPNVGKARQIFNIKI